MNKQLMKACLLLAALTPLSAMAVPASRKPVRLTQPDGSVVTLWLHGDERSHYATDGRGYPVEMAANGFYYYIGEDGMPSDLRMDQMQAASATPRAEAMSALKPAEVLRAYLAHRPKVAERGFYAAPKTAALGKRKVPVLLVEFPDASFTLGTKERFNDMLNKEGYDYDGATGSCLDYFKDNSNGLFTPEFDVFGPVLLDHNREYYGQNDANGNELNLGYMIKEACQKLDDEIDFSQYDYDGDGMLDYVYVYYAGMGEHDTQDKSLVWPQSWNMSSTNAGQFKCDGVTVEKFATSNELQASGKFAGIGIFVHEFSHVLGLPDLYATTYSPTAFTPGDWSVLAHGSYNNEGRTPPNYSAYERSALGWLDLKELAKPDDVSLAPVSDNVGCRISTEKSDEYYVFENRQQEGWDKYIPGHGMLVWHIDYNATRWQNNLVNTDSRHQYVDIVEADNILTEETRAGDAFPGTRHVAEFTDDTTPSMQSWGGQRLGKPITAIAESADGIVSFKVMGGHRDLHAPTDITADVPAPTGFMLSWAPCADCDYQLADVYTKSADGGKSYVEGYKSLRLSADANTLAVGGLEPSTTYYVTITSCTDYEQAAAQELDVTTAAPTFDMLKAETAEPTEVSADGFVANWLPLEGADSYELSVKKRTIDLTPCSETCDFTGKTLADGWTGSVSSYFSAGGYYGEAAPAASLAESGQYIESGRYGEVTSLSLWMRTMSYSSLCSLKVLGMKNGEWIEIDDVPMPQTNDGGQTKSWTLADATMPEGLTAVRFELSTTGDKAGRLLLDDIRVGYTLPYEDDVFADYNRKNVGNATSARLEALENGKLYLYTVRGVKGGVESMESEARLVQLGTTGVESLLIGGGVSVAGNVLTVSATAGVRLQIAGVAGECILNKVLSHDGIYSVRLESGLYVVRVGDKTFKIKI